MEQGIGPFHDNDCITMPASFNRQWIEQTNFSDLKPERTVRLDFRQTQCVDSAALAVMYHLHSTFSGAGQRLILCNMKTDVLGMLNRWWIAPEKRSGDTKKEGFIAGLGDKALRMYTSAYNAMLMLVEILYWGSFGLLKRRDFRRGVFTEQLYLFGVKATGIVALLSFLVGTILSIQGLSVLKQFSAEIFLVPMITILMIQELGPLLTAVILAGRTGSATTAEIATMKVQEELDAVTVMGLNPVQFVVVPKFWAMTLAMPLLATFSVVIGIFGGYTANLLFAHIPLSLFFEKIIINITFRDVIISLCKTVVFSWLIIWVGSFYGFRVRGGAEEVGKETTGSVVTGIFIIIVADALFSFAYVR